VEREDRACWSTSCWTAGPCSPRCSRSDRFGWPTTQPPSLPSVPLPTRSSGPPSPQASPAGSPWPSGSPSCTACSRPRSRPPAVAVGRQRCRVMRRPGSWAARTAASPAPSGRSCGCRRRSAPAPRVRVGLRRRSCRGPAARLPTTTSRRPTSSSSSCGGAVRWVPRACAQYVHSDQVAFLDRRDLLGVHAHRLIAGVGQRVGRRAGQRPDVQGEFSASAGGGEGVGTGAGGRQE
jgi:hypothetical protein